MVLYFVMALNFFFVEDVKTKQGLDPILVELTEAVLKSFSKGGYGVIIY